MNGFIFDYGGTLNVLADPLGYVRSIKKKYIDYEVIMYSGTEADEIEKYHPGLVGEMRLLITKPDLVVPALESAGIVLRRVIFVDDDPIMRKVMGKVFKSIDCVTYSPDRLVDLI